ncbi:MAG: helix-turn-helix domain-containing protein [Blastocatellia bacterium]
MANNSIYGPKLFERLLEAYGVDNGNQLAAKLGITNVSTGAWKNGKASPEFDRLIQARKDTGVSIDWLLTGEGPQTVNDLKAAASDAIDLDRVRREAVAAYKAGLLRAITKDEFVQEEKRKAS